MPNDQDLDNAIEAIVADANMLATPAITVPAGFTESGLPVGLQIGGGLHADALVQRVAAQFERARPWHDKRPARNGTARS